MKKFFLIIAWLLFPALLDIGIFAQTNSIFLLTYEHGIFKSDTGGSWARCNDGLPKKIIPLNITAHKSDTGHTLYLTTLNSGLYKYTTWEQRWKNISSPDFKRRSQYPFNTKKYRKISAFAFDTTDVNNILAATKHSLYRSRNGGRSWNRVTIKGFHSRNYITALAIKGSTLVIGTSFNGVFIYKKGRLIQKNRGLARQQYTRHHFFTEPVTSLAYNGTTIYAGTQFGNGLYYTSDKKIAWKNLKLPIDRKQEKKDFFTIRSIKPYKQDLYISTDHNRFRILKYSPSEKKQHYANINYRHIIRTLPATVKPIAFFSINSNYPPLLYFIKPYNSYKPIEKRVTNRYALYASVPTIRKKLKTYISTLKSTGHNAIVIDMKDDFGNIYFPTKNTLAKKIRAAKKTLNINRILKQLKQNNIYTIARVVVFKDPKMYRAFNNRYAILNSKTGRAWKGTEHEYWVDPFSDIVQDYNVSLAKELEELGFDEIQFDYIRFPSDGPTHLCSYRYRKDRETYKSEILSDFLERAKHSISIPVSTDIYGFNSWYLSGNWIGQDIEEFSNIVDVVCPMVYPSHFGNRFYMDGKRSNRSFRIVYDGGIRSRQLSGTSTIRPYIQAFRLLAPTWGTDYIYNQALGAYKSGCSGHTYWNASGNYRIIRKTFNKKPIKNNRYSNSTVFN